MDETIRLAARRLDMRGYVVLPKAAPIKLIERYRSLIGDVADRTRDNPSNFYFIQFDPDCFTWVMEHPVVQPLIHMFCGDYARLDDHFCLSHPGNDPHPEIRGGPFSAARTVYYHNQGPICQTSSLRVGITLRDTRGIAFVAGSHKSHERVADVEQQELSRPKLVCGDVVVFTGAMLHGERPSAAPRQTLYYTFTPGHVARVAYVEPTWLHLVPPSRRLFFRAPGVVDVDAEDRMNVTWRQPTF